MLRLYSMSVSWILIRSISRFEKDESQDSRAVVLALVRASDSSSAATADKSSPMVSLVSMVMTLSNVCLELTPPYRKTRPLGPKQTVWL